MATTVLRGQCSGSVPARSAASAAPADSSSAPNSALGELVKACDSRFIGTSAEFQRRSLLADRILELDEPWRTRFIELIAQRVDSTAVAQKLPSRMQIVVWLSDRQLARLVEQMLRSWACEDL